MIGITPAQKIRLGIFVTLCLSILSGAVIYLAGRTLVEKRDSYLIRFPDKEINLSGMEIGSEVKYTGVRIGRVEKVRLAEGDVSTLEVLISVPKGTPIAENSVAQVAMAGITGLKYIELTRGTADARLRQPGETIPSGQSMVDELSARALSIAGQLQKVLDNLQVMTGPDSSVQGLLKSSQQVIEDNRGQVAGILADTHKITQDLTVFSERGVVVVSQAEQLLTTLNSAGGKVNSALGPEGTLLRTLEQTETLLQRVNLLVLRSENDLDVTLRNLREASANLADFSLAVRDNPTLLLNNPAARGVPEGP